MWLGDLRHLHQSSAAYGAREREGGCERPLDYRRLGESGGPLSEHQSWNWGRVRLFIIVAYHDWVREASMDRLGIKLSGSTARLATTAPPAAAGAPSAPVLASEGGIGPPNRLDCVSCTHETKQNKINACI